MSRYYDRQGRPMGDDVIEWAKSFEADDRVVEQIEEHGHFVSTVWLGLDHGLGYGPPLIFETMIFCRHEPDCDLNEWTERYSTEDEAKQGHAKAVALVVERGPNGDQ